MLLTHMTKACIHITFQNQHWKLFHLTYEAIGNMLIEQKLTYPWLLLIWTLTSRCSLPSFFAYFCSPKQRYMLQLGKFQVLKSQKDKPYCKLQHLYMWHEFSNFHVAYTRYVSHTSSILWIKRTNPRARTFYKSC